MRILQVIGGGEKGGSRNYLLTLAQELIKQGHEVEIICFLDDGVAEGARTQEIPVTIFPMKHIADIKVITKLRQYLLEKKADVIHTHGVRANFVGRLAARTIDVPVVTTVHSSIYHDYSHPLKKLFYHRIEKMTRKYTNHYIAVAASLKKEVEQDGINSNRIDVVYNGLSPDFAYDAGRPSSLREELGIGEEIPVLITIGRLEAVKNQAMFLDIVALLLKQIQFHGVIVGEGPLRGELEEKAQTLGIENHVSFLGFREDIYSLLSQSDLFILTSRMEGLPITLLEAMAGRTPAVVSEVGGMPEVVKLAQNGFVVPAGDVEQFAARIQHLLKEPELRLELADKGYESLMQHFTGEMFIENTLKVYKKVCTIWQGGKS